MISTWLEDDIVLGPVERCYRNGRNGFLLEMAVLEKQLTGLQFVKVFSMCFCREMKKNS